MSDVNPQDYVFYKVAKPIDIPDGERLFFVLEKHPIVLYSIKGEYYAMEDLCTHDQGPIGSGELDGDVIICPRHGARFDVHTGKVLSFPAVEDVPVFPVRLNEEYVEVGLPK